MSIADLQHVSFTYDGQDEPALSDVTLRLEPGLLYGVVGANASGKSTLCSLVRGLIPNFHSCTICSGGGVAGCLIYIVADSFLLFVLNYNK